MSSNQKIEKNRLDEEWNYLRPKTMGSFNYFEHKTKGVQNLDEPALAFSADYKTDTGTNWGVGWLMVSFSAAHGPHVEKDGDKPVDDELSDLRLGSELLAQETWPICQQANNLGP